MRILIVGNNKPWSIERYFVKYLREFGTDVILYNSGDIVYDFHTKNLFNKVLFHSKLVTKYPEVNAGLLSIARKSEPDVIWVIKGMEIYPETLSQLRREGHRLANYNPDHPFIITSKGSGNRNVTESVGLYDLHFCYQRLLMEEIRERFNLPSVFLPFAYDEDDVVYTNPHEIEEINRLCFQGNPDSYRVKILIMLADSGIPIDVYGHGWAKTDLAGRAGINIFPIASRQQFWRKNQEYRVQLNLFREYNFGSHNMRTFEIPIVGGVQLTTFSQEQEEFFTENEEIFFFRNEEDMINKATNVLSIRKPEIEYFREKARKRSMNSGYSFRDRSRTVYDVFKSLN